MITVKEEFLGSVKTKLAVRLGGSDAIVLWLALKGYASSSNSGGFVPEESIDDIEGVPPKWRARAMPALLNCGKLRPDGSRGPGLVERATHGYQLHDYEDHGTSIEAEEVRRAKARDQKRRRREEQRRQLEELKAATLSADSPPDAPPDNGADSPPDDDTDSTPDKVAEGGADRPPDPRARAGTRPPERAPARDPSPAQPSQLDLPPGSDGTEAGDPDPDQPATSGSRGAGGGRRRPKRPFPDDFPHASEFFETTRARGYPDWWVANRHSAYCDRAVAKGWVYADWRRAFLDFLAGEIGYSRGPKDLAHLAPRGASEASGLTPEQRARIEQREADLREQARRREAELLGRSDDA